MVKRSVIPCQDRSTDPMQGCYVTASRDGMLSWWSLDMVRLRSAQSTCRNYLPLVIVPVLHYKNALAALKKNQISDCIQTMIVILLSVKRYSSNVILL